jgi:hypothetical protein
VKGTPGAGRGPFQRFWGQAPKHPVVSCHSMEKPCRREAAPPPGRRGSPRVSRGAGSTFTPNSSAASACVARSKLSQVRKDYSILHALCCGPSSAVGRQHVCSVPRRQDSSTGRACPAKKDRLVARKAGVKNNYKKSSCAHTLLLSTMQDVHAQQQHAPTHSPARSASEGGRPHPSLALRAGST